MAKKNKKPLQLPDFSVRLYLSFSCHKGMRHESKHRISRKHNQF